MSDCLSVVIAVGCLLLNIGHGSSQLCQQSQPVMNNVNYSAVETLSGDLQLLIPAWRFLVDEATVIRWEASVEGTATPGSIEFQIYQPLFPGGFKLIERNIFQNQTSSDQSDSILTINVSSVANPPEILVERDDVIGIRIRNSTPEADPDFGLQYINAEPGEGVDVYYWNKMEDQDCFINSPSPSTAKVLRNIIPLVSWTFCVNPSILTIQRFFLYQNAYPLKCPGTQSPSMISTSTPFATGTVSHTKTMPSMLSSTPIGIFQTDGTVTSTDFPQWGVAILVVGVVAIVLVLVLAAFITIGSIAFVCWRIVSRKQKSRANLRFSSNIPIQQQPSILYLPSNQNTLSAYYDEVLPSDNSVAEQQVLMENTGIYTYIRDTPENQSKKQQEQEEVDNIKTVDNSNDSLYMFKNAAYQTQLSIESSNGQIRDWDTVDNGSIIMNQGRQSSSLPMIKNAAYGFNHLLKH